MRDPKVVVKVGGSLFDWPELGPRLSRWLDTLSSNKVLLVPGGGPIVDVIRNLDRWHGIGEEKAHWLALRALTVNAHFLAALLRNSVIITDLREAEVAWERPELPILDPYRFVQEDDTQTGCLPHCWSATSDSLAARIAARVHARKLILLKSTEIPEDWLNPTRGIVDPYFEKMVHVSQPGSDPALVVAAVDFRRWRG
jgi:aspartokinase-like uncharacterized kinase